MGDDYTLTALGPDGLIGTSFLRLDGTAPDVNAANVPLLDWSAASLQDSIVARPSQPLRQAILSLPQGTKTVHVHVGLADGWPGEPFHFAARERGGHYCDVAAQLISEGWNVVVNENQYSYAILLNDQVIASGGGNYCSTVDWPLFETVVDVSAATAQQDAQLRLIARSTSPSVPASTIYGELYVTATIPARFAITAVRPLDGPGPLQAFRPSTRKDDPKVYRLVGVPDGARATHNKWGLRIAYAPADAEILNVRVYLQYLWTGASEDLTFTQPLPAANGLITFQNVGFAAYGAERPLWTTKSDDAAVVVEVEARLPDQSSAIAIARLGRGARPGDQGWNLTPLYDAGLISGALRYSTDRETNLGGDGWGAKSAFQFLSMHSSLIFNDLSLEHGGEFRPHGAHQAGTSIDVRYLGPGGESNVLNRSPAERFARWQQAREGDVAARREMVAWIRANRTAMDQLLADSRVSSILVGNAPWNFNPIVHGTYGDAQTEIVDPDTNVAIGAWQYTGRVKAQAKHLDHLHIELHPRTRGNDTP